MEGRYPALYWFRIARRCVYMYSLTSFPQLVGEYIVERWKSEIHHRPLNEYARPSALYASYMKFRYTAPFRKQIGDLH